jgi:putative RNA 2'-phosphotransferase
MLEIIEIQLFMNDKQLKSISKQLSYILRHHPDSVGLVLDENGWVRVEALLNAVKIERNVLETIVAENDKKRFAFNDDKTMIRASQGHSIKIELGYEPSVPPDILYHGTASSNLKSIQNQGLIKGNRHHVHLSADTDTARKVGMRHGIPVILTVLAGQMGTDGYNFFVSENGVWLTEHVPPRYLK